MKIQINGFDIELNTEESNMTIKVMDANGKELANNTYSQSSASEAEVTQVPVPAAQDTPPAQPTPAQDSAVQNVGESFVPDFETFRKLKKEGKI